MHVLIFQNRPAVCSILGKHNGAPLSFEHGLKYVADECIVIDYQNSAASGKSHED
jgi:hypothetical protein